jgi:hypothetical protein
MKPQTYEQVIQALKDNGFNVKLYKPSAECKYPRAEFTGHCLIGVVADPDSDCPDFMQYTIIAEYAPMFDKWKDCDFRRSWKNEPISRILKDLLEFSEAQVTLTRIISTH